MKVYSVNFHLKGKTPYKDLAPVFPDILKMLLEEIGQVPEEEEILEMLIDLNVKDLEKNIKPEGYNRKGKVRLVFPMGSNEFYIKTYIKNQDLSHIADSIGSMLTAAGIKFTTSENEDVEFNRSSSRHALSRPSSFSSGWTKLPQSDHYSDFHKSYIFQSSIIIIICLIIHL